MIGGYERLREEVGAAQVKSPVQSLAERRFLFVTGKGGVGKTTVSAALATAMAAQGKRVLIAMCHTKERLSVVMGSAPIGDKVDQVGENIWATNISPEVALYEYGEMVLKIKTLTHALFGNQHVKAFFRAVPGLHEWVMLGKAWFHTTEKDKHGKNRFDVVILDAPATGHGLDMLRVPKVILDVVPPGALRRDAEIAWKMLQDPKQSGVVLVTLPEEMPVTETLELAATLKSELHLPLLQIFVNGMLEPLFTEEERAELSNLPEFLAVTAPGKAKAGGVSAAIAGARRAVRENGQLESVRRLFASIDAPIAWLPFLFDEASTKQGTKLLAQELSGATMIGR